MLELSPVSRGNLGSARHRSPRARVTTLDFIEIDYSLENRNAAETLLPLAQERGIAVLINVSFGGRSATVLQEMANRLLPDWAADAP